MKVISVDLVNGEPIMCTDGNLTADEESLKSEVYRFALGIFGITRAEDNNE